MKRILLTGLIFIAACAIAHAQTASIPQLINYQGKLTDAQGQELATAEYSLEFNIYDSPTAGTPVWGPQKFDGVAGQGHGSTVPVLRGYFNVILGPVDTAGRPIVSACATGPNRVLGIKVNGGVEIQPRQQILSAPFAVSAATTESLSAYKDGVQRRIFLESLDGSSNLIFETAGGVDEGSIFRSTQSGQLAKINSSGLVVSTGTIHSATGGFKFPDNTVQTTAFPKPTLPWADQVQPPDDYRKTIWTGDWGTWRTWYYCPSGTYVCGARVKYESSVGSADDTAMNGIEFACCPF